MCIRDSLTCFATVIPIVGTTLVWFPLAAYMAISGDWPHAIGLLLYCGLIAVSYTHLHTYAAGLSMKVENVEEFTHRFETYVSEHILPEQTSAVIDIDAEIDFRDITPKFHADLKKFNPFGPDNHKPVFCTHNVYDYGTSKVVGRDQEHIKLELVDNK